MRVTTLERRTLGDEIQELRSGDGTLDEIQREPTLLSAVKRSVDRERRPGRFLLTGSANLLLMQRVSESLAGRASYLALWPMTRRGLPQRQAQPFFRTCTGNW